MEWLVARDLVATRRQVLTHQIWECLGGIISHFAFEPT
jgi:hypothetical protein